MDRTYSAGGGLPAGIAAAALPNLDQALRLTSAFLTGPMMQSLRAVEHPMPAFTTEPINLDQETWLDEVGRAEVEVRHVPGATDALYRIRAFGDVLTMRLQLNVWRFVIVYALPSNDLVDVAGVAPRFERWQTGAAHAGWTIGWRDAVDPWEHDVHMVETYCYAMLPQDFLVNPLAQLYWRNDIMQMTRAFMLEARRVGVSLGKNSSHQMNR